MLAAFPTEDVRVYAVWFQMMPGDARSEWPRKLLTDSRVVHFWDESRVIGTWYGQRTKSIRSKLTADSEWGDRGVLWDAYLLYDASGNWEGDDLPTGLILWGRTIVAARGSLYDFLSSRPRTELPRSR